MSDQPTSGVVVYVTTLCPYCTAAKRLLDELEQPYQLIDVGRDRARYQEMIQLANGRTSVPQIFIGERHVGGCDDLYAAHRGGELDGWLAELED
jgi:glutaredoxin 3